MSKSLLINIWTDGACKVKERKGGWAFLAQYKSDITKSEIVKSGCVLDTTNNQMELMAVKQAIDTFYDAHLTIYTDSACVIGWLTKIWNRDNLDIRMTCQEIETIAEAHKVTYDLIKIKGHDSDPNNIRVDKMAVEAYEK